jgi:hypothetical protein
MFYGIIKEGSACELNISRHEQYPPIVRTKIIKPMLFANYPKQGTFFFINLNNTPLDYNKYVMEPKIIII